MISMGIDVLFSLYILKIMEGVDNPTDEYPDIHQWGKKNV